VTGTTSTSTPGGATSAGARRRLAALRWEGMLLILLVASVVIATNLSPFYLDADQIMLAMRYTMVAGLLALGLMVVVVVGEIDVSQASIVAFGAVIFAACSQAGLPLIAALPIVIVLCVLLGIFNGVVVVRFGVPSLAVTIGTMAAYRGVAFIIGGDTGYTDFDDSYLWLGAQRSPVPPAIILFGIAAIVLAVVMARSTFGARCYAIGNNALAARFSGVSVGRVKVAAFAASAGAAALAAWVLIGQYGSARGDNAEGITLFVVTTVVLGGIDIYGGRGSVLGVVLSLLVLGTLSNGMGLANVPGPTQTVVFGLLLIASVLIPRMRSIASSLRRATRSRLAAGTGGA
jgi:rhamnose transport system permease protein